MSAELIGKIEALAKRQDELYKIDADLRDLFISHLNTKIASDDFRIIDTCKGYINEITLTFNPLLLYTMAITVTGTPIEQVLHQLSMQSDVPS